MKNAVGCILKNNEIKRELLVINVVAQTIIGSGTNGLISVNPVNHAKPFVVGQ